MTPFSKAAKVTFFVVLALTGIFLILSVGVSIWSQIGEEGWVAKAAFAVMCWIVTLPFILTTVIWEAILLLTRNSRARSQHHSSAQVQAQASQQNQGQTQASPQETSVNESGSG